MRDQNVPPPQNNMLIGKITSTLSSWGIKISHPLWTIRWLRDINSGQTSRLQRTCSMCGFPSNIKYHPNKGTTIQWIGPIMANTKPEVSLRGSIRQKEWIPYLAPIIYEPYIPKMKFPVFVLDHCTGSSAGIYLPKPWPLLFGFGIYLLRMTTAMKINLTHLKTTYITHLNSRYLKIPSGSD